MCRYCKRLQELKKQDEKIIERWKCYCDRQERMLVKADEIITHLRSMVSENNVSLYWKYEMCDFSDFLRKVLKEDTING